MESISVNSIEQAVLEGAREAGKRLFLAFLELIERTLPKNRICDCGGRLQSRGRVDRELMTVVGDGIENAEKIDFYGSGPVEKAVDVTICSRFKKRGMRAGMFIKQTLP